MMKNENAAGRAPTPPTASTNATTPAKQSCNPYFNCTTPSASTASIFDGILKHGAENAIDTPTLCALLGVTPRKLRDMVLRVRDSGGIVLYQPGGKSGYFLPSLDPDHRRAELWAFYRTMRTRCRHGLASLAPVRRELEKLVGQLAFDELAAGQTEPRE